MKGVFILMFCFLFFCHASSQQDTTRQKKVLCELGLIFGYNDGGNLAIEYFIRKKISISVLNTLTDEKTTTASYSYQSQQPGIISTHSSTCLKGYNYFAGIVPKFYWSLEGYDKWRFYIGTGLACHKHESTYFIAATNPDYSYNVKLWWYNLTSVLIPGGHYKFKRGMIVVEFPFFFSLRKNQKMHFSNVLPPQDVPDRSITLLGIDALNFKVGYAYEF